MNEFTPQQLDQLSNLIRVGSSEASRALSTWLNKDVQVWVEQLQQASLETAVEQLGPVAEIVCACCMRVSGGINGQLLLGFDDASGLMLCDMLLAQERTSKEWGEIEISAAMETTNIVGCAFLNSLSLVFPKSPELADSSETPAGTTWIPTPPVFVRDYAAAIMQFALMDQASLFDTVLLAQTRFTIDGTPVKWQLLLIPDAEVIARLAEILG
jgi:chemotaxis protein CheC